MGTRSQRSLTGKALHAEVLRYLAREEPLAATLSAFPQLDRAQLEKLILRAAGQLETDHAASQGPAPRLRMRLYCDGASRGNPGPAGAGAVLVEPGGAVIDRQGKFLGRQTTLFAEYQGLLLGLLRARDLGVGEVEVFSDSELMIRQLGSRYQVRSPSLRPLYDEARRLLDQFDRVKLVHVPREMNRAADELSNRAIDLQS
jgi:ribonuclease HI